ncbi:rhamnogalacturonan lyase B-like protein 3 [Elsinoe australis]|uniref:rhamnogalacturonan endolyase n=1 Tax=Elsinoe australis TaxID=40998 RepID=A0A4U7AZ28_9PEZI|nr:rhamnogalacturonan lyase B-like protein 3 [Elsinoe australis]
MFSKLLVASALCAQACLASPFLQQLNGTTWIIGNDLWNMTQNEKYGTKLWYKGRDLVDEAVGHYVSYNGAKNDLAWTSAQIALQTEDYIDVQFDAVEGEMHWVIYNDLPGAYQYFINRALPRLGEFRTLWRLDNETFPRGRTDIKDGVLPALSEYRAATNVQDETWQKADGTFLTKYDWSAFIRTQDYYGVYGDEFGSWYINPGKDYYNGDQLKQELMVHRESQTGDAVQLNMIHGTHFQALSSDDFANGKIWGPWLWYLNDGNQTDVAARAASECSQWPYSWLQNPTYQSRVRSVSGTLLLSDGRPASGAAIHLGDNRSNLSTLDQGSNNYYTTYADASGSFTISHVLTGTYALQAWSNGGPLSNITTTFLQNDIDLTVPSSSDLTLNLTTWPLPASRSRVFQVGDFDRKSLGFRYGGAPYQHGLVSQCPANLTFTIGVSPTDAWCFGQSALGKWDIDFSLSEDEVARNGNSSAILSVSLAGYSQGTSSGIFVNGMDAGSRVGNLTSGSVPSDQCLYRSATTAGEWHFFEFPVAAGRLRAGRNTVSFVVEKTTVWRGFLWDSIVLDWA